MRRLNSKQLTLSVMHVADETAIAVLLTRPDERELVSRVVGARTRVLFCEDIDALKRTVQHTTLHAILVDLSNGCGRSAPSTLQSIIHAHPQLPLAVIVSFSTDDLRVTAQLPSCHAVVIRGYDDLGLTVHELMSACQQHRGHIEIQSALAPYLPQSVIPYLAYLAKCARGDMSVLDAVRAAGLTRRTLARHLRCSRAPSPRTLLTLVGLLRAAWLETEHGWKRDAVARELGFASGQALTSLLRRHAGLSWAELKGPHAFTALKCAVQRRLTLYHELTTHDHSIERLQLAACSGS